MAKIPRKRQSGSGLQPESNFEIKRVKISELLLDDRNANRGTDLGKKLLQTSVAKFGAGRGVLVDKRLKVIAGNHAVRELEDAGIENVVVVPTDGKTLVVTQRVDIDKDSKDGHELAIADNRVAQANLDFDTDLIRELDAEFNMDLGDFAMSFDGARDIDSDHGENDGLSSESNVKHSNALEIDEQSGSSGTYALIVALSDKEREELDEWMKENDIKSDQQAFRKMFKIAKTRNNE